MKAALKMTDSLDYLQKKYNLDFSQPSPIYIPNVGRNDLIRWIRELEMKVGVEVGVAAGEYAKLLVETNFQLKLYGIDKYEIYAGYNDFEANEIKQIRAESFSRLKPYVDRNRFEFVYKHSMDALEDFKDESLDFVYIDANHSNPFITQDITGWEKKVRRGGIVAGHDYISMRKGSSHDDWAVKDAVIAYTQKHNITPWFVLGRKEILDNEVRDGLPSWMFVK